jgi:hypothetical protein
LTWVCPLLMAPGLVTMAVLLADDASLDGVMRRRLAEDEGAPRSDVGDTMSISAATTAERTGVEAIVERKKRRTSFTPCVGEERK